MQDTITDSSFIYIIEIPVQVTMEVENDKFHIVQVGSGSVGAQGLKKRMQEHYRAWHYATGAVNVFSKPKATPDMYTFEKIQEMNNIVGIIGRSKQNKEDTKSSEAETDDDDEDSIDRIAESEAFVRELVGVRLRTCLIRDLLTQPFVSSWGGRSVLDKGRHFSITELRLVSEPELKKLKEWFKAEWNANRVARLSKFIDEIATVSRTNISNVNLKLTCEYKDTPPSTPVTSTTNRMAAKTGFTPHLISRIRNADTTSNTEFESDESGGALCDSGAILDSESESVDKSGEPERSPSGIDQFAS